MLNIFVECHPNEDIRDFHVNRNFAVKPWNRHSSDKPMPKKIQRLENALARLPQVGGFDHNDRVRRNTIRIEINKAYSWDQVIDSIAPVIAKFFREEDFSVEVMERNPEWDKPQKDYPYDY